MNGDQSTALAADAGGPYSGDEGSLITFRSRARTKIVSYEWDLDGDGEYDDATGPKAKYTWGDDYSGNIGLKVTNNRGKTDSDSTTIEIANVAPVVKAGKDENVKTGEVVSFSGSFTDPGDDKWTIAWDFGDGETDTGTLTPTHEYADEDVYSVTLTVTDDDGGVGTDTLTVTVESDTVQPSPSPTPTPPPPTPPSPQPTPNKPPIADAGSNQLVYITRTVHFDGYLSSDPDGVIESYIWSFGDDASASGVKVSHVYASEGVYTATLTVTDNKGVTASDTCIITIVALTPDEILGLSPGEAAEDLTRISPEDAVEILMEVNTSAAAEIFEEMNVTTAVHMAEVALYLARVRELGSVLGYLSPETMNSIYGGLTDIERATIYPYLPSETVAVIKVKLLPLPDLTPLFITVSRLERLGYTVTATIENRGSFDSGNLTVDLRTDTQLIDRIEIASLSAEASTTVTYEWRPTFPGVYTLMVMVDPYNIVDEVSEDNNELTIGYGVELPDLTVSLTTVPMKLVERKTYTIEVEVSNIGEEDTGAFDLTLEASGVTVKARWISTTVGKSDVEQLAPGSSRTLQFSWKPEEAGAYTLEAAVDPQEKVWEGYETNNIDKVYVTIEVRRHTWLLIVAVVMVVIVAMTMLLSFLRGRILGATFPFVFSSSRAPARILALLREVRSRYFQQILSKVGFYYNTLRHYLVRLIEQGLEIRRRRSQEGFRIPQFIYTLPEGVDGQAASPLLDPYKEVVVLSFEELQRICRHREGGYCKEMRGRCKTQSCPQIVKKG